MTGALLFGFLCGFLGSMPVAGPVAALVLSRSLENRSKAAMATATGSAFAEAPYAFMAFWGLSALITAHRGLLGASNLMAACALAGLGVYFLLHRIRHGAADTDASRRAGWGDALVGFTMTIANPTLIVTWTATVGIVHSTGGVRIQPVDAVPFALGAWGGILGWFSLLVLLVDRFRAHVNERTLDRTIRVMGGALVLLGSGLAVRALAAVLGQQ